MNMEIEITLNESNSCANCTSTEKRNEQGEEEEECQNLDYEVLNSSLEKLQQVMSVLTGLKEFTKSLMDSDQGRIRLCFPCNLILWELYKRIEEFNSVRKIDSLISQIVEAQCQSQSVGVNNNDNADNNNMDVAVTLASIDLTNTALPLPTSIVIHPQQQVQEEEENSQVQVPHLNLTNSNVIFRDDSIEMNLNNGDIYTITDDGNGNHSQVLKQFQFVSEPTATTVLSGNNSQRNPSTIIPPDPEIQCQVIEMSSDSGSSKEETTIGEREEPLLDGITPTNYPGIAVPIGDDLLQLYQVIPVIPKGPPFTCCYCQKTKESLISLKNHIYNVHEARSLRCDVCSKSFKKPSQLKKHSLTHQEEYLEEIRSKKTHKNSMRKRKPLLVCSWPNCGKTFRFNVSMSRHAARHRPERPFICDHPGCNKGFKIAGDLKIHRQFHNSSRNHVCEKCGKSYKVISNLKTHMNNSHSEEGRRRYNAYMRKKTMQIRRNTKQSSQNPEPSNNAIIVMGDQQLTTQEVQVVLDEQEELETTSEGK